MSPIKLEVVSAERLVYSDDVDTVIAPGVEGQLGILPHHAPLMTMLESGELLIKKGTDEISLVVSGGFMEVRPDQIIVLADAAERIEEIDVTRAEEARRRAEEKLEHRASNIDLEKAEMALKRSLVRLKAVDKIKKRRPLA